MIEEFIYIALVISVGVALATGFACFSLLLIDIVLDALGFKRF